jgi:very-short-patch-repair endonuclease/endogenous inhibitor of DNA gyrase (YacG/DUF329 family)
MSFITCINCGKLQEFHGKGAYQHKFCSEECRIIYNTINCVICGNLFVTNGKQKTFYRTTCSKICENILRSSSLVGRKFSDIHIHNLSIGQKKRVENGYDFASQFNNYIKEFGSWNKGFTKETDERVKNVGNAIKETMNDPIWLNTIGIKKIEKLHENCSHPSWNKGLTKQDTPLLKEIGKNISKSYHEKTPEERYAIWGHCRKTNTKPELLFKEILKLLDIEYKHNYQLYSIKHFYPADFYLEKYNLIIEIDGAYWHNYPHGTEKDHIRTQEISDSGMNILRIWDFELPIIRQNLFILKTLLYFIEVQK